MDRFKVNRVTQVERQGDTFLAQASVTRIVGGEEGSTEDVTLGVGIFPDGVRVYNLRGSKRKRIRISNQKSLIDKVRGKNPEFAEAIRE